MPLNIVSNIVIVSGKYRAFNGFCTKIEEILPAYARTLARMHAPINRIFANC